MIKIPTENEVIEYLDHRVAIEKAFNDAIRLSNNLDYVMDLCGLEFPASSYGTKIQTWLNEKYGWENIPSQLNEGDFRTEKRRFNELKCSIIKKGTQANLLNLRLDTPVEDYLFIIRCMRQRLTKMFYIPKENVQYMVDTFKEGKYNKHKGAHASIRVCVDSIVWEDDPEMNLWSNLHQFEITEADLPNL